MERFARLCAEIADARSDDDRVALLCAYLRAADADDAALAAWLLGGGRPARALTRSALRDAALRAAALPDWLFAACYRAVGNLAETIALVLPPPERTSALSLGAWFREHVVPLAGLAPDAIAARLADDWAVLDIAARIVHTQLATGTFRPPLPQPLVARAVERARGDGESTARMSDASTGSERRDAAPGDLLRVAAVLVYAERATPRGYALRKYTFAVWDERDGASRLTPIAKLDVDGDDERKALDALVRRTTSERFGPVHGVTPTLVCEIAFEAIERSPRHKSGLALRGARFVRRLPARAIGEAATLASLQALLDAGTGEKPPT